MRGLNSIGLLLLAASLMPACGADDTQAFEWDINLNRDGSEDWSDNLRYRLNFVPNTASVNLSIGDETFAKGTISGCSINYQSVVWGELRDGFEVRWKIDGEAIYQQNGGCETQLPEGVDWDGTEVFSIVLSDHPEIPVGATYTLTTQGTYAGQVGQ